MKNILKVSEIFKSIQGEGRYQGTPVLFVRLAGCTRKCSFCDSKYHKEGKEVGFKQIYGMMYKNIASTIVITGGEPLLQWKQLKRFLNKYFPYYGKVKLHIETNGDLIKDQKIFKEMLEYFNYICISPKEERTAKRVYSIVKEYKEKNCCGSNGFVDIKIVTDLYQIGVSMVKYSSILMPLTTYSSKKDQEIRKRVWNYCVSKNKFYSARLHVDIFGKKRAI
jgi:organic radical activating enzyme